MPTNFPRSQWLLICVLGLSLGCEGSAGPAGPSGPEGPAGAAGPKGTDGVDGQAGSCTATDNNDGTFTIDCDGEVITVADGTDGTNGTDGVPGASCTATDNGDGTYTIDCDGNVINVSDGEDLTRPEYQPWNSARPISKRVHAVHRGADLNFPNATVDYRADPIAGRNWQIHFPQDIRNCETCHPSGETSGSWKDNPGRLPCSGCHDSEAAQAHFTINTWDPTPMLPFSGDEEESCAACHGAGGQLELEVENFHGLEHYLSSGEFTPCGPGVDPEQPDDCNKSFATITITGATADVNGLATVSFHVEDAVGDPITEFDPTISGWKSDLQLAIVALEPAGTRPGIGYSRWVPYIVTKIEVGAAGSWPNPVGTRDYMGAREDIEDHGTFDRTGAATGDYTYTFSVDLDNVLTDDDGDPILDSTGTPIVSSYVTYDRTWTHRVAVWTGGHEGPTAAATYDFRPSDGATPPTAGVETRDIVQTSVCQDCHGEFEFHGHGGDRLLVEDCNMCHNESYKSPYNDESLSMAVMVHKIHAGGELASIPGPDGKVWDDPNTMADESADNGQYVIYRNFRGTVRTYEWWNAAFPAVIENCTKCHTGGGADVDAWKMNPSRDACGSCHDVTDFTETDSNAESYHAGGVQNSDNACATCHPDTGTPTALVAPIIESHDWIAHDPRSTPEFDVELTVSAPGNGTHFVAGEAPMVTVVIKDKATGTAIDHNTVMQDTDGAEGCTAAEAASDTCPDGDGMFRQAYLFITGPRAERNPALGTAAHAEVASSSTGPFNLTANETLKLVVDGGQTVVKFDSNGGDTKLPGMITVDVSDGTFANLGAATSAEIVTWLNADSAFAARAIAWVEAGHVMVRSRNLGKVFTMKLDKSDVTTSVFGGDTDPHYVKGFYARNLIYKHTDAADDDPKATWTTANITYQLDAVDDLKPGTYVVSVEIADRGRVNSSDYWVPAVDRITFQVGTATEEKPVAKDCDRCHQSAPNVGLVGDPSRHNKYFGDDAIDQCGACHDYQPYR